MYSFLVDPERPPQAVRFLNGRVWEVVGSSLGVAGARVEILDGYNGGKSTLTGSSGGYELERVVTGETFRLRVSKEGYSTITVEHRLEEWPRQSGFFLDLYLPRLAAS